MSFKTNEKIKRLLAEGKIIDFSVDFKIGDTVDSETILLLIDTALHESSDLIQKNDIFCFVDNDSGERLPCYITFSKENSFWVFRGACFEDSIINRCGGFLYIPQTIGEYCVEVFNNAYLKAITKMYSESKNINSKNVDDYINHNALTIAGYLISIYGDTVLKTFEEKGAELCREELLEDVLELLKHKDDVYEDENLSFLKIK